MEAFLGTISHHAMNYAIRSGIGLTASFAIGQTTRLLKTVEDDGDRSELQRLRELLNLKTSILSPAIALIERMSARGNTTLENAVTLTKSLRWQIQSLGVRIEKAAGAEELSRKKTQRAKSRAAHAIEIREIIQDIRKLLAQIREDAPFIHLAIATSGVSNSTTLPTTVSPARLLQASTFLRDGDTEYIMGFGDPVQIGPTFTLTLYMLFAGHSYRTHDEENKTREFTWKEVMHKTRVKLIRSSGNEFGPHMKAEELSNAPMKSIEGDGSEIPVLPNQGFQSRYFYHLEIIEDFEDDRVHSFEEGEPQPGPYGGVELAGIREQMPVYQISKMFYADTSKLGINSEEETYTPVLLFKRDLNAPSSRMMMQETEKRTEWDEYVEDHMPPEEEGYDSQEDIDQQIKRESSVQPLTETPTEDSAARHEPWALPADLDSEWLAFEIYNEEASDSNSEDEQELNGNWSAFNERDSTEDSLVKGVSQLNLSPGSTPATASRSDDPMRSSFSPREDNVPLSSIGPIRSSLSLLEMLVRLTVAQQVEQKPHLSMYDEDLSFYLEQSSSTGTGGNDSERQRVRAAAKSKVGFDPYNESPVKRRNAPLQEEPNEARYMDGSEDDQQSQYSRSGTLYDQDRRYGSPRSVTPYSPYFNSRLTSTSPQGTPQWLRRSTEASPRTTIEMPSSSPASPYRPQRKTVNAGPLDRLQRERAGDGVKGSPLGRGVSVDTDSSLGTSPGSPTLVGERSTKS